MSPTFVPASGLIISGGMKSHDRVLYMTAMSLRAASVRTVVSKDKHAQTFSSRWLSVNGAD